MTFIFYRSFCYLFIYLFIYFFYAGPMLIAVFLTEMVILHKYVLLFIIIIEMPADIVKLTSFAFPSKTLVSLKKACHFHV